MRNSPNEFIEALQIPNQSQGQIAEFNRRYREVDVLLIDDIQFLAARKRPFEQFFHTFNTLHQANKRIVIASDVAPKNLKGFEERLISRFESGPDRGRQTAGSGDPNRHSSHDRLHERLGNIPNDVFNLIAERFTENIRELEGALTRVTAMASLSNQPVTKALGRADVAGLLHHRCGNQAHGHHQQVAKYFHLTFDDIVGRSRTKNIALARQIAMYLVREK